MANQYRSPSNGPEYHIEVAVKNNIQRIFPQLQEFWLGECIQIGAGYPDLIVVSYIPSVINLAQIHTKCTSILGYLRTIKSARPDTIALKTTIPLKLINKYLHDLSLIRAVSKHSNSFRLEPEWRQILEEVITIEVKVSNWKRAIEQASRNRIFSNRSYIAVPEGIAQRVVSEKLLGKLGIGLISVPKDDNICILKRSRLFRPKVWDYYYNIAAVLAQQIGRSHGIHHDN